jgi:hypothetical protein
VLHYTVPYGTITYGTVTYLVSRRQSRRLKREISTLATSFFLVLVFAIIRTQRGPEKGTGERKGDRNRKGEGEEGGDEREKEEGEEMKERNRTGRRWEGEGREREGRAVQYK